MSFPSRPARRRSPSGCGPAPPPSRRGARCSSVALGRTRLVVPDRLVDGGWWAEDAGGAHHDDCILDGVRVTRHPYEVPGWGVGEVWVRDGTIIQHELASEARSREAVARGGEGARVQRRTRRPLPFPPRGERGVPARTVAAPCVTGSCRIRAGSVPADRRAPGRGSRPRTRRSRSISTGRRRCSTSSPRRHARSRGARSSPTGSSPRSLGGRARPARRGRSAPTTATR